MQTLPSLALTLTLTLTLALAAAAPRTAHAGDKKTALIGEVERAVKALDGVTSEGHSRHHVFERQVGEAKTCVDAVAAALKGKVKASQDIRVSQDKSEIPHTKEEREDSGWVYYARLDAVGSYCDDLYSGLRTTRVKKALVAAVEAKQRADGMTELDDADVALLKGEVIRCNDTVDWALASGLPAKTTIEVSSSLKVQLGDAKTKACKPLEDATTKMSSALAAASEAELAPFKKVLKGDKLDIFVERGFIDLEVYTKDEYYLETPEDFADASLWFIILSTEGDDGYTWWILRRFQFRGNTLVKESETTGRGDDPPSSAYK